MVRQYQKLTKRRKKTAAMIGTRRSDPPMNSIRDAALYMQPISGLTHRFYRYPARYSPKFASACIEAFSKPGDVVLDPYMGGATTVVEAMVLGRRAIGSDINSLSVFVARAKCSGLTEFERRSIGQWATEIVPKIRCQEPVRDSVRYGRIPRNMAAPEARWLRKLLSLCMESSAANLATASARRFATCVLLNVGQWALDGSRRTPSAGEFRKRIEIATTAMLAGASELESALRANEAERYEPVLRRIDAERIDRDPHITAVGSADLVVTSPPYPGIHMLYHRWQVDGRRETDAPYWIANCTDGSGATYYNFADRKLGAEERYFEKAIRSFSAVRRVMKSGAILAQLVAFSDPVRQLRRYLRAMEASGFEEMHQPRARRIWRAVPSRRWHANMKGELSSSKEVVLIHAAV